MNRTSEQWRAMVKEQRDKLGQRWMDIGKIQDEAEMEADDATVTELMEFRRGLWQGIEALDELLRSDDGPDGRDGRDGQPEGAQSAGGNERNEVP